MKATTKARKKRSMRMIVSDSDFHSGSIVDTCNTQIGHVEP